MSTATESNLNADKANRIWDEYAGAHDLTGKERMAVGIDPQTGEVFLGESALEISDRLKQEGRFRPLFYRWVHSPFYTRKVGRRWSAK
jgi:hypothetical protein